MSQITQSELIDFLAYKTWYDLASTKGNSLSAEGTMTRIKLPKKQFPATEALLRQTPIQCRDLHIPKTEFELIIKEWEKAGAYLITYQRRFYYLDLLATIGGKTYSAKLRLAPVTTIES